MQRFMETNKITYNLMSFSAFKGILIFTYLLEGPKSFKQIQDFLLSHEYVTESVSIDTIRIYINTLKKIGCDIQKETKHRISYFYIASHPFKLKITEQQANDILKIFKAISKSIDLEDFMALRGFFEKIAPYISNDELKEQLENISPLKISNFELIIELLKYAKSKTEITVEYDSPRSGVKNIDILADKLYITNEKLYLAGFNSEYENYGSLLVDKIHKVVCINTNKPKLEIPALTVRYKYAKNDNDIFEPNDEETIVSENKDEVIVEITSKNKFLITQRILSLANKCTVISPENYKDEIISCLKQMKEVYFGQE